MKPVTKIYQISLGNEGTWADSLYLKQSIDSDGLRPCDFGGSDERGIMLPWMTKSEMVAWLRKAADELEKHDFE